MAMLTCAISNEVPEDPVVSPASGSVFERRLIEKYLSENGVDPVSKKPLESSELIPLKVNNALTKPRAPSATSIPAILKSLQDEWDSVMLYSFNLRQQLQTARQELSHALYQHDAACRVIARLSKEAAAAKEALATLKPHHEVAATANQGPATSNEATATASTPSANEASLMEACGMSNEIVSHLQERATVLTKERKKRSKAGPEDLMPAVELKRFNRIANYPGLHSASVPGILALDIKAGDSNLMVTGGADKSAAIFNRESEQVLAILKGHQKKVNRVVYHPSTAFDRVITASYDATVRLWDVTNAQAIKVLKAHDAPITGLSLHATGDFVLTTSLDQHWAFIDVNAGKLIVKVNNDEENNSKESNAVLTCAQFHPDGLIFGVGTSNHVVNIWDIKQQKNAANIEGHSGQISSLCFSENGYHLATAAEDGCIKLWDLRSLKNFKTLQMEENYEIRDLCFDQSGLYLGVAGSDVKVYQAKEWNELVSFKEHLPIATSIRFGHRANFVASAGMDRTLKIYGL